jgi:hypothetical protein
MTTKSRNFINYLFLLLAFFSFSACSAEPKWTRIGDTEFYYDPSSAQKNGDLASVNFLIAGSGLVSKVRVDCKKKSMWLSDKEKIAAPESPMRLMMDDICKFKWFPL